MIIIKAVAYKDQALQQPISGTFDEIGGTIGRADGNNLVLPDNDRYISRNHAAVLMRGGRYVILDQGTAVPVIVNGRELGTGQEAPIADGDEIRIGGYVLRVVGATPGAVEERTMIRPVGSGLLPEDPIPAPPAPAIPASPMPSASMASDDPLAMFGGGGGQGGGDDPFGDLLQPAPAPRAPLKADPSQAPVPAAPASFAPAPYMPEPVPPISSGHAIPADFDPFADLSPAPAPVMSDNPLGLPTGQLPDDFDLGLAPAPSEQNIDSLFGLGSGASSDPFDVLGQGLGEVPPPAPQPAQRDDAPELQGSFRMPTPQGAAAPAPAEPDPEPLVPADPPPASGMVLSWEDVEPSGIRTMIVESSKEPSTETDAEMPRQMPHDDRPDPTGTMPGLAAQAYFPEESADGDVPAFAAAPAPAPVQAPPPAVARPATGRTAPPDELLQAFLKGAGVPDLPMPGPLSPQLMEIFGQLLREATQGTLDLLLARALTKREVHAEVTMIVARENNPLKFSPTAEVALTHLLAPQGRGFMTPVRAMRDAYNDLRSHQLGFMAGMQAALSGMLERFDPAHLEKRLTQKSMIDSLLPMGRKSKLWDLFSDLYGDISKEAEDDFHALFGKEFLRAYEEQIAKLEEEQEANKR
jgi:FHA domain-containing protein